ncbi:MAG: asparagine synthetase B, partial [Acidobacteriota bacterium]|nr:asparagine synthetase B [Acidobacteriota bacterium]
MTERLVHRGPDDDGFHNDANVSFGMRRLSVIDPQHGAQPIRNEDGSVVAVYNGEIYNFQALRQELEQRGHRFASRTDGEVIVHLWEEFGDGAFEKLNGMFAVAVHDRGKGRVVLARD